MGEAGEHEGRLGRLRDLVANALQDEFDWLNERQCRWAAEEAVRTLYEAGLLSYPHDVAKHLVVSGDGALFTAWQPGQECHTCGSKRTGQDDDGVAVCYSCGARDDDE